MPEPTIEPAWAALVCLRAHVYVCHARVGHVGVRARFCVAAAEPAAGNGCVCKWSAASSRVLTRRAMVLCRAAVRRRSRSAATAGRP